MDPRLLPYYERELRYVRELGAEFAEHFPKVAGRLGISELACADPHVERLLEGFAFLAARVHLELDAEFPRLTQHLLQLVYPNYLAPTPSMAMVQFVPNPRESALADGCLVPRGTVLSARVPLRDASACEFRTAHDVKLWPFEIEDVSYTTALGSLAVVSSALRERVKAVLRVRLRTYAGKRFNSLALASLPLYLRGTDDLSAKLHEQLVTSASALALRWGPRGNERTVFSTESKPVRQLGLEDEQALLPVDPRAFQGYRLLQEYFAFPTRYDCVELTGLTQGVARCDSDTLELLIALTRADSVLEGAVDKERLALFATPAINLFARKGDRMPMPDRRHELHIVLDRTRPLDFEVHTLQRMTIHVAGSDMATEIFPMYAPHASGQRVRGRAHSAHYVQERRARRLSERERRLGSRSPYVGSELFVTLTPPAQSSGEQPAAKSQQLGVDALCTNRDLPLLLSIGRGGYSEREGSDFSARTSAPVSAVRCLAGPSEPRSTPIDGDMAWRLVSQLSHHYLSLCRRDGRADALRDLLALYAHCGDPVLAHQIEGVRGLSASSVLRPIPGSVPRSFVRGLEVVLSCDEPAFSGHGAFKLASVLAAFFAKHASINSFSECVLCTRERGEVYRWPAQLGVRNTL